MYRQGIGYPGKQGFANYCTDKACLVSTTLKKLIPSLHSRKAGFRFAQRPIISKINSH